MLNKVIHLDRSEESCPFRKPQQAVAPTVVVMGINHKTAPIELRECIAFSKEDTDKALRKFQEHPAISEVLVLSTCNRMEILMVTGDKAFAIEAAKRFISEFKGLAPEQFEESLYIYDNDDAVRHIFRVASSLDSMVVGEPQILGQLKDAYRTAAVRKTSGVILNRLLHKTFSVAKRVRSETGIGDHAVSISYAAIELGRKIFGTLEDKKVLLIGAGEMAELAVEHLIRNRAGDIYVANRTFERGLELARRFGGKALRFEEIEACLEIADIIISSTGSPDFVVRSEQVKRSMKSRRNRPLFFIDIAVPRDIEPKINRLPNAYLYDIDDLKGVIEENVDDRNREAMKAERIIDEGVIVFRKWYDSLDVVPTIVVLRRKIESIARSEAEKTLHSLSHLSENDRDAISRMTQALINKILHEPTCFLKNNGFYANKSQCIDIARKLFGLDDDNDAG